MSRIILSSILAIVPAFCAFRPPAVPLITHDPYFSIWSASDKLNGSATRHWTGTNMEIDSMIRIDGATYRLMGVDPARIPAEDRTEPLPQTSVEVLPTRTIYEFDGAGVHVQLLFLTPALPRNLDVLSRHTTYVVWRVRSSDGKDHAVSVYFDATANVVIDNPQQSVNWSRLSLNGATALRMGNQEQPVLGKSGDNLRIDWGYLYLAAPAGEGISTAAVERRAAAGSFKRTGKLPSTDDFEIHRARRNLLPALAYAFDMGKVGSAQASRHMVVAYDDLYSIEYFQRKLRPYWRRKGADAVALLESAMSEYEAVAAESVRFDDALMADLRRAGGEDYARLSALAYRQAIAAHKLVADLDGSPLLFSKENFSNGCIATVDVTYPSSPLFMLVNPALLKAMLKPIMDYASLERWRFPFAPHDLGTYPLANGQVYGGGERTEENQMPVEESGNMLIMAAALAEAEGNAGFAEKYWPLLERWAAYLKEKGLDPENQLSTDDFAGHLAHNANLSIKAILALGSFAKLADRLGKKQEAALYRATAQDFAKRWTTMAADGNHYKLAFDKSGTWSQKYNLVWDKLLGLNLFSPAIARQEISFYKTVQNAYGLPLDNREKYTKLDWIVWTATLAESRGDFDAIISPVLKFLNETPDRVPMTDWYWTHDGKWRGFQARSVVGGVFIKMLAEPETWRKWRARN